jgi:hypothetical protein
MTTLRATACALALLIAATSTAWAAEKKKPVRKPAGRTETLACRLGTEDRHARIAVVVIKGRTDSFAYYSKWKPRTCSIYLQRDRDSYSKWADNGDVTTVNLEKGAFLIEHKSKPGEYHFIFRDIDRERYCGMDGVINGSLTIKRGNDKCVLDGDIMVEGTPLGEANKFATVETPAPSAGASDIPAQIAAPAAAPVAAEPKTAAPAPAPVAAEQQGGAPMETANATPPAEAQPAAAAQAAAPASTEPASPPTAAASTPAAAPAVEKAADTSSTNPLRAFFRSLAPSAAEVDTP